MIQQTFFWIGLFACGEKSTPTTTDTASEVQEALDSDGDGLTDEQEESFGSDPNNPDSDGDGLQDASEQEEGTDPNSADSDGDGLGDLEEVQGSTDPNNPDSDGDGFDDAYELQYDTNPMNPDEYPLFPNNGSWSHQNPQFTNDGCNLESVLQNQGGDIFTFFPQDFDVTDSDPESFTLTIEQNTSCILSSGSFECNRLYDSVAIETPDVTLDLEFAMEGQVINADAMANLCF